MQPRRTLLSWLSALIVASLLLAGAGRVPAARADHTPPPEKVVIPGTVQSVLGCAGDWMPDCDNTALTYDAAADLWVGTFELPVGEYEYKAALNGSWTENYGLGGVSSGPNIPLAISEPISVTFIYDHKTHWIMDSVNNVLATVAGTFQAALGCAEDWMPACLNTWMNDADGDGVYSFTTTALAPGDYEAKVALNQNWTESYGDAGGANIPFTVAEAGKEIYFGYNAETHAVTISVEGAPHGDLNKAQAQWVAPDTIAWKIGTPAEGTTFALYYAPDGGLALEPGAITGGEALPLDYSFGGLSSRITLPYPNLNGYNALKLAAADVARVPELLKGQVAVAALDADGRVLDATSVQIPIVLDALYAYSGALGVTYTGDTPTIRVWAPTAKNVSLQLYADATTPSALTVPMTLDGSTGVWTAEGTPAWTGQFYLFAVEVYVPSTGAVETNLVTDPYSFSLSTNSLRSQIVNLDDPALKPAGWDDLAKPPLAAPEDGVIYELHIRDFSISDNSVPEAERGTYLAFTEANSAGMTHLKALAAAGLTTVHLLPAFDIASVDEDKATWQTVSEAVLEGMAPDSDQQQATLAEVRDSDGFNWGYDPFHYTAPEGSYATDPDGSARILEFRQMVQALNEAGLRVVMDVVYNHTNASGQDAKSVLDKIVPGYYHRLNAEGRVETSTCCQNTATEHAMMEKLMVDSVLTWATQYKVDGFRFDLMGHHLLSNMQNLRTALDALTPAADGVDGPAVYVYGEGWDFGEVAQNARGKNASQLNIGGTGIGVFNDRLRDAVRGGSPFSAKPEQGFITGLFTDPSAFDQGTEAEQRLRLLHAADLIKVGLAGNLADYEIVDMTGDTVRGGRIDYNGAPAGYTLDPQENINYISAHDNETLFDAIQWKAPAGATMADRVRMNSLGQSLVLLGQGVPFFHAGDDLLRSKSLDGNSYNSGDWFNRIDWTYQTNNWGVGLPGFLNDQWEAMGALLADPALKPAPADIQAATASFQEMLQIRRSSRLFRLETLAEVQQHLSFYNNGPDQVPGLIVMALENSGADRLPDAYDRIVVLFNAAPEAVTFADPAFAEAAFELHPVQQASVDAALAEAAYDAAAGSFTVPGRSAVVFVVASTAPAATVPAPTATSVPPTATEPAPTATQPPTSVPTATRVPPTATTASLTTGTPVAPTSTPAATTTPSVPPPLPPAVAPAGLAVWVSLLFAAALGAVYVWQRRAR